MQEFYILIKNKINEILNFINKLQKTIGLSTSTDTTIFGKINNIESKLGSLIIPKYFVETIEITNDIFFTTYIPFNGVCLNNEVTLYHPDGSTLIWEGVEFLRNKGTLQDSNNEYDGWKVKIQYFYL